MPDSDHYSTLHVPRDATIDEIRRNYIKLAKAFHPDTGDGDGRVASEVTTAWNVLKDPSRRAAYDAILQAAAQSSNRQTDFEKEAPFVDGWGTEASWREAPPVHVAPGEGPIVPGRSDRIVPPAPLKRSRYLRGESRAATITGAAWLALSALPAVVSGIAAPSQAWSGVITVSLLGAASFAVGVRRIIKPITLSRLYVVWVSLSLSIVVISVLSIQSSRVVESVGGAIYVLAWLVSYVWAVELRRREFTTQ